MLLQRQLSDEYRDWNRLWGAPSGRRNRAARVALRTLGRLGRSHGDVALKAGGPFSIQPNNDTRVIEYPWAFFASELSPGLKVVELGGALSGFQFAAAKSGCDVTNVDPGEEDQAYWDLPLRITAENFGRLNRVFGTAVELHPGTLESAHFESQSVDRIVSISAIEHIPPEQLPSLAREVGKILRPGGLCVLTIDLFLDLEPFTDRETNHWGRNIDVASLVSDSGLELAHGDPTVLVGFDQFDPREVMARLSECYVGVEYPVCAQGLVLRAPTDDAVL